MAVSFGLVLVCNCIVQARLDYSLEHAAFLDNTVDIKTEQAMNEVPVGLFNRSLLEVVMDFNIVFFTPL